MILIYSTTRTVDICVHLKCQLVVCMFEKLLQRQVVYSEELRSEAHSYFEILNKEYSWANCWAY